MMVMTNKQNKAQGEQPDATPSASELQQLRQIVFGDAQQQLITQITTMRCDLEDALNAQEQSFLQRLAKMQKNNEQQFSSMDQRIQNFDKTHDEHEASIQKDLNSLASEHEILATTTQQDFKSMEQSLDSESNTLSSNFTEQLEQLKAHLEDVSKELSSSKTDRKTLAKLLATMATNLEDDQL
jgi:hypothetical protein